MAPKPKADVAAQNRRKIEKDRRRNNYHDSQVQGTNNSSIVSKRSVEMLYNPILDPGSHDWFLHFVPKGKRRSPAINRGYWVRMESIKQSVLRIQKHHGETVQVVNLGCGFDPFSYKMLADKEDLAFFDLDYPELVQRKLGMIELAPEIMRVIGEPQAISPEERALGVVLSTEKYKLVGCDLKNTALYEKQVGLLLSQTPAVFIAEVSLAYMKPEHANAVARLLAQLPKCHFLVLEQIMPAGEKHFFAQKMLYHFDHLTSPLQCVKTYSTKDKQRERFLEYFPSVQVVDLFQSWNSLVSDDNKRKVHSVEDFDEWEEFIIFCQHYVVIHATNSDFRLFPASQTSSNTMPLRRLSMERVENEPAKFSAACVGGLGTYVFGGMVQTRTQKMVLLPREEIVFENGPLPRMCHTLTPLGDNKLLLVGGRARPGFPMKDVWVFDETTRLWEQQEDLSLGLSRHSAVAVKPGVLVFSRGAFLHFELGGTATPQRLSLQGVPPLVSAGMAYDPTRKVGYIVGGMIDETIPEISDVLYAFVWSSDHVQVSKVAQSPHFARIGCMAHVLGLQLYILGGAGHELQNQRSTVLNYDLESGLFRGCDMLDAIWESGPLFVGSSLVGGKAAIGGGAVCYSFGSSYNPGYSIDFVGYTQSI